VFSAVPLWARGPLDLNGGVLDLEPDRQFVVQPVEHRIRVGIGADAGVQRDQRALGRQ